MYGKPPIILSLHNPAKAAPLPNISSLPEVFRRINRNAFTWSGLQSLDGRCNLQIAFLVSALLSTFWFVPAAVANEDSAKNFQAGVYAVDVTPTEFPVIINGFFQERSTDRAFDRLMSRALILDDGKSRLAIVVVDSLMLPRSLLDQAKQTAAKATGIPVDRMLISATHTHSAASAMPCLGSRTDANYARFLPDQIAKSITIANQKLMPVRIGWTVVNVPEHTHCRRWFFRADQIATDPFGHKTVLANMHPGHQSPIHISPAGPADHDLSLLAIQSTDGRLISLVGNYAVHHFDPNPLSAGATGVFGSKFHALLEESEVHPDFVGMLSQGTSGECHWMDYSRPASERIQNFELYAESLAKDALPAIRTIKYHDWVPLGMAEKTLRFSRRTPDAARLEWARQTVAKLGNQRPTTLPDIYAHEQIDLDKEPEVEIKLQALRIGSLGITAIPNEVYALTGLKLKAQSPLKTTFNIELANGAQGYIPPPEQHHLGGYTTWPAKTAGLEVHAEPIIVETLLALLEEVAEKPRRSIPLTTSAYSEAVMKSAPVAYWQFEEMEGFSAIDRTNSHHGKYEPRTARYLPGPVGEGLSAGFRGNRAVHFAGGRMRPSCGELSDTYTLECWVWNGLPHDALPITGYFFSRGKDSAASATGDHLGIGGTSQEETAGKLIFSNGNQSQQRLVGKTRLKLKTWHHIALVRANGQVTVYLDGQTTPEIMGNAEVTYSADEEEIFIGGRSDRFSSLQGKVDEVSLYDRALTDEEILTHFKAAYQ